MFEADVFGIKVTADSGDELIESIVNAVTSSHVSGYYYSKTREKYLPIKEMNPVHARNAANKLLREGGNKETIKELLSRALGELKVHREEKEDALCSV